MEKAHIGNAYCLILGMSGYKNMFKLNINLLV